MQPYARQLVRTKVPPTPHVFCSTPQLWFEDAAWKNSNLRPQVPEKPLDPPCILWDLKDTSEPMTWSRSEASDDGYRQGPRTCRITRQPRRKTTLGRMFLKFSSPNILSPTRGRNQPGFLPLVRKHCFSHTQPARPFRDPFRDCFLQTKHLFDSLSFYAHHIILSSYLNFPIPKVL